MYIGETTGGIPQPVFWDSHTQIFNNQPPGTLVTGSPGSGKSFLAMTLTCIAAILGKTTIVLDPKGDFLSLYELRDQIGKINFWNLSDRRHKGVLDPFYLADNDSDRLDLVITVVDMFLGGLNANEKRVLAPVVKDVMKEKVPSLLRVVETLQMSPNPEARNLGASLDLISKLQFAELCFASGNRNRGSMSIDSGLTVVTMVGMELSPDTANQNNKQRLASTIFFLVTDFIRRVMHKSSDKKPKVLVIDEAWAVLNTPAGASVVKEVALLGRSKSLALILVTQNASHLKNLDIENTIRTRFAFKTDTKEAESIVRSMNLPESEGFEHILIDLGQGECLMQDFTGRYSTVQISNYNKEWADAFETNPLEKAKKQKQKQQASRK